jgi:hypothetical protein
LPPGLNKGTARLAYLLRLTTYALKLYFFAVELSESV